VRKGNKTIVVLLLVIAACVIAAGAYSFGKTAGEKPLLEARERLFTLNRASIENISIEDGTVYVIGHRSPDSDTVCSAIAYARLLSSLGYPAEAAITEPVNRETAYILKEAGVEAPPVLEDAAGKSIFLVDHSEYAQAAQGMEDAHIVGILDHHGVGTVTTGHQVVYEAKPIGSTATIVWLDYLNYGVELDKATAALLLGAVLSDTTNLTGSTVTEADRQAVPDLAARAGIVDAGAFYRGLHAEALSYEGMSDEEILFSDYKEYEASGVKFGIGLLSVVEEDASRAMAARMKEVLPQGFAAKQVDLMYASVGIREDGLKIDYIVPANEKSRQVFEAAFPDYDEYDGTSYIFRSGLGRKTKFVPGLTEFLNAHPHE
jgi:manganese-dependent inorganic pyrophosphatase